MQLVVGICIGVMTGRVLYQLRGSYKSKARAGGGCVGKSTLLISSSESFNVNYFL